MDARHRTGRYAVAVVVAATALALYGGRPVRAQIEHRGLQPPELIQLSGHVGKPLPQETGGWNLKLGVRFTPAYYDYHLFELRVVNSGRLGDEILFAVEPYDPSFYLFGSAEQFAQLASVTPQELVKITGWRRPGSRVLMVTEITSSPASTPAER